jgi:alkylglycerol monooxygenase
MISARWRHRLSNYGCGALALLSSATLGPLVLAAYCALAPLSAPLFPSSGPVAFLAAFLAVDLLYYLQHRAEHRVAALWAIHAVHHQSNLCDTSVSLRVSALAPLSVLATHLVLALLGVPFAVYFPVYALHAALVFLLHARTPRWLDRAGWVFNSPYLHRAHHSSHARFRGKNLGGVLIVWDRLLGTYEPACDDVTRFGVGEAPTPLNPLAANLRPLGALWRRARAP